MKKVYTILFMLVSGFVSMNAQRKCGTMEQLELIKQNDPGVLPARQEIERFTQDFIANGGAESGGRALINIPVVVHVIYNTSSQNVSDAQILSQLTVLNNDFRKLNADRTATPSVFQALVADAEVQFCLAQRDPNGNASTGIVRKSTSTTSFSVNDAMKYSSSGGDNAWPSSSYLNLWVCNLSGGILGYAQFPGGTAAKDGVVIHYQAFGNTGTAVAPYNKGRTATHEVGHWLNLYHIWGDDGTACTGSDNVSDTPNQADENYGCPAFPAVSCSNGPNGDMFMNYMDYTDDACMFMFTTGQKARMQALFATGGARVSLVSSLGCTAPVAGSCGTSASLATTGISQTGATISWSAVSGATSYNLQYKSSAASTYTSISTTALTINLSGLTAATLYNYQVKAVCGVTSGAFTASTFTTLSNTTTCTDVYESNNTRTAAKPINANTTIQAIISSSTDKDYFSFSNTTAQKNIRVTLSGLPADYDLKLYNSSGTLLSTSQNSGTTSETIKYNTTSVGTYYAYVYGYGGVYNTSACYSLNASISGTAYKLEEDLANDSGKPTTHVVPNLYPNPSSGNVVLELNFLESSEMVSISVFDMLGKLIKTDNYQNVEGLFSTTLNMTEASNGIYTVSIKSDFGQDSRKLIIAR
jgi:hypothetical protein